MIVTADDFGLALPVNEAIEIAYRDGVLTSASLMVAEGAAGDAVDRARRLPGLAVGLHVTVVDGRTILPRAQLSRLVDRSGRLSDRLVLAGVRYFFSPMARRQLRAEVRAQFEAFRATGLPLDHVDAHRHMHLHPTVLGAILAVAREFNVRAVRVPYEPLRAAGVASGGPLTRLWARLAAASRAAGLVPWLALVRWRLHRAGIRYNTDVRGLAATGRMTEQTVLRLVATLGRGTTEFFFHPATATPFAGTLPQPIANHVAELDALVSARVRGALESSGARRVAFRDLD